MRKLAVAFATLMFAATAQAQSVTTLTFSSDWNETASASIVAGGTIAIDYDENRLPNCRASHNGNPGWQITAFVMAQPSGQISEQGIFTYEMTESGPDYHTWIKTIPEFDVPEGTTSVQIWFRNDSAFDHPCTEWDSNYGANYGFGVVQANMVGSMNFKADWTNELGGNVVRGGKLQVTYATERMVTITEVHNDNYLASAYHCYGYGCCTHQYDTVMHVRFQDSGSFQNYPINDGMVEVDIPVGASRVEIYFDSHVTTLVTFCGSGNPPSYAGSDYFYDSNFGNNFVLTIP